MLIRWCWQLALSLADVFILAVKGNNWFANKLLSQVAKRQKKVGLLVVLATLRLVRLAMLCVRLALKPLVSKPALLHVFCENRWVYMVESEALLEENWLRQTNELDWLSAFDRTTGRAASWTNVFSDEREFNASFSSHFESFVLFDAHKRVDSWISVEIHWWCKGIFWILFVFVVDFFWKKIELFSDSSVLFIFK